MLLLTTVTFGGQDSVAVFDHLPDDEGELLRHRALELLKIPREKRIPLLVQEIKRLVTARRAQAWAADPEGLARVLGGERPALVEVVLRALPQGTAEAVRKHLPPSSQKAKLVRDVKAPILNLIRWKLEAAFARSGRPQGFKFSDVLLLRSRELLTVCDRLGVRALVQALAGLPAEVREDFLGKLRPDQRQLATRALAASPRALGEEDAQTLIALHQAERDPATAVQSAGAQRLARAALAQSPEFAARLGERHPGPLGQLLQRWIREERPRVTGRVDGGRVDVVAELDRLERQGIIERPVRLPPPPKAQPPPPAPQARSPLPGGQVLVPAPKPRRPEEERPAEKVPPRPQAREPEAPAWRDPIAARNARRAGVSLPQPEQERRPDAIAEREARRAGIPHQRPPAAQAPAKERKGKDEPPMASDRTSLQRSPRPGGRGPRGGSG